MDPFRVLSRSSSTSRGPAYSFSVGQEGSPLRAHITITAALFVVTGSMRFCKQAEVAELHMRDGIIGM
jgi:hypothetical protein